MFGSNFLGNFGIPDFGFQGADPQGGYFGTNTPGQDPSQFAAPEAGQLNLGTAPPSAASPSHPSIAGSNPLAGGPLALGGGQTPQQQNANPGGSQAPAAGIGSPFGKPGL